MGHRRQGTLVALVLGAVAVFSAYGRADVSAPGAGSESAGAWMARQKVSAVEEPARRNEVSVIGPWAGPDLESFWATVQPFAQHYGVRVSFESTPNVASILAARVEAATPPDLAILPGVGLVEHYARAGCLVPLRRALDADALRAQYPATWTEAVSVEGELYGVYCRATNESLVWYSPGEFQRRKWTVPMTWGEMVKLGEQIARQGLAPWALGLGGRPAGGEPGTDWIENIMLRACGPETYDRWVRHEIPWTDQAVREAFVRWGEIVGRPRNLRGGTSGTLETESADSAGALYQCVPEAFLCLQRSSALPSIVRQFPQQAGARDYDFFALPPMALGEEAPVLAGADVMVVFADTPQTRALLRYLVSPEAEAIWVRGGGFVAPKRDVKLNQYPDPLSRRAARQLLEAPVVRFDASEQMPPPVADAFRSAVREFVANPARLQAILERVERVAERGYATARTPAPCGTASLVPRGTSRPATPEKARPQCTGVSDQPGAAVATAMATATPPRACRPGAWWGRCVRVVPRYPNAGAHGGAPGGRATGSMPNGRAPEGSPQPGTTEGTPTP